MPASFLGSVMLVDDSKVDNFINTKILEMSEKARNIQVFDDASNALDFLRKTQDLPNVIFLDIYMPSMNGFDFLEEFNTLPVHIKDKSKIILLSSAFETLELERLKKYNWVSGYIVKPLTYESLNDVPVEA